MRRTGTVKLAYALLAMVALLTVMLTPVVAEEPSRPEITTFSGDVLPKVKAEQRLGPPPVGTIQYDNNVPFNRSGIGGGVVGNRFVAGVSDPHSFASASFRMANVFGTAAILGVFDVNTAMGTVSTIQALTVTGLTAGTAMTAVVPLAGSSHSGSFIGGMFQTAYTPCSGLTSLNSALTCEGVALTQGSLAGGPGDPGQGFNAVRIATVGTTGIAIPNQNAIFRVTGQNLPVELMSFAID